jgi:hypothetical protein
MIAVSTLISLGALGLQTVGDAEKERTKHPLLGVAASAELSLNFEGVDMAGIWEAIKANDHLERRPELHYGQHRVVVLHPPDFSSVTHQDYLDYATRGTRIRLDFVTPEAASSRPAASSEDEIRPIAAPTSVNGPISVALEFNRIEADLDRRKMTAYFSGEYKPKVEGDIDSGDRLWLSDVKKLVPILTIQRSRRYERGPGKRGPDTLLHVSFKLTETQRFDASPKFNIGDKASFSLHPQPER